MGLAVFEIIMIAVFRTDCLALDRHILLGTEFGKEIMKDFLGVMLFRLQRELRRRVVRVDGASVGADEILESGTLS